MSSELFVKGLCVAIFSGCVAWVVFSRFDEEIGSESDNSGRQRYLPYMNGLLLPTFLLILTIGFAHLYGIKESIQIILPLCFNVFLHISVFYLGLMLISPLLRKRISARACALLWMLPNYLYLLYNNTFSLSRPRYILHISSNWMWILFGIWIIGFVFVLIRSLIQHMLFRKMILNPAKIVTDPQVLQVWQDELQKARIKKPRYKLYTSPNVSTPLSIGFWSRTICVVLPEKHYSSEELALIFRHEIIHICRCDCLNKFFHMFCCAMCWFNPLVWIAMRKSAEDMELSCDETVLLDADESTRRQYANLILNTAADGRGFTTCLSATKSALRYRLTNIVAKRNLNTGALLCALVCFVLFMSYGNVALVFGNDLCMTQIYDYTGSNNANDLEIYGLNYTVGEYHGLDNCKDEDALTEYILNLPVSRLSGNYTMSDYDKMLLIFYDAPDRSIAVELKDQTLQIVQMGANSTKPTAYYHISTEVDWNYLESLFVFS